MSASEKTDGQIVDCAMDKTPAQKWAELMELAKIHGKPYATTTTLVSVPQWLFNRMIAWKKDESNG